MGRIIVPTAISVEPVKKTSTGQVVTGEGYLFGLLIGTDRSTDPTFSVYDNTAASGTELFPTTEIDASVKGFNGFYPGTVCIHFANGMYMSISGGTNEVFFYYKLKADLGDYIIA